MPLPTMCNRACRLFAPLSQHEPSNNCKSFCRAPFCGSLSRNDLQKVARAFVEVLTNAVCYAAKWLKSSFTHLGEEGHEEGPRPLYSSGLQSIRRCRSYSDHLPQPA